MFALPSSFWKPFLDLNTSMLKNATDTNGRQHKSVFLRPTNHQSQNLETPIWNPRLCGTGADGALVNYPDQQDFQTPKLGNSDLEPKQGQMALWSIIRRPLPLFKLFKQPILYRERGAPAAVHNC